MDTAAPHINDLVERTRHRYFDDGRRQLADIRVESHANEARVRGDVLDREAADRFMVALRAQAPQITWRDELTTLVAGPDYSWALCQRSVSDVRRDPDNHAERVTQALYGEAIEVLRYHERWVFVRLSDGYLGWMHVEPLYTCTSEYAQTYQQARTHFVKQLFAPCYVQPSGSPHDQRGLLPFGTAVPVDGHNGAMQRVRWPDGTIRWIAACDLIERDTIASANRSGLRSIVPWLNLLIGVPYLWGGKTAFGIDCSGLMQLVFTLLGVPLQRDADQQARAGTPATFDQLDLGDLIFFDTHSSNAQIEVAPPVDEVTHVALALSRTEFIHSSWRGGGVVWGSFDPHSPHYTPTYERRFLGARRYLQNGEE